MSCPPSEGYLFDGIKPRNLQPGRARYIARRKARLMQTAVLEPHTGGEPM